MLLAAALSLSLYNRYEANRGGAAAEHALKELEIQKDIQTIPELSQDNELPAYLLDPAIEMPTTEIDGVAYIGVLEIPSLDLSLPIISQWSNSNLKLAPCRYKGSAYLDNLIIAGHNYKRHFTALKKLEIGAELFFTDESGNRFSYRVSNFEELPGTAIEQMEGGDWDMTLFTCTAGGKARFTIRCLKT